MAESSGGIRAGQAYVELFLKNNIERSLNDIQRKLSSFGSTISGAGLKLAGLGGGLTAPLLVAAQRYAAMGDEITRAAQKTGIGVEALTGLKFAADESGVEFDALTAAVTKMDKGLLDGKADKALQAINIPIEQLQSLSPEQKFDAIAQGLSQVRDDGARAGLAMDIFGKSGAELLPLFNNGAAGIKEMTDHARDLGVTFDKSDADGATRFQHSLKDLVAQVQALTFQVGETVARALQPFADGLTKVLAAVIQYAKQNRVLVLEVFAVGAALVTAGAALIAFGTAVRLVGLAISGLTTTFSLISTGLLILSNPIVLIGVGLVALAGYFLLAGQRGAQTVAFLKEKFGELKDVATEAFSGIADALSAGDISLAAQILWVGLKTAFLTGTFELQKYWIAFRAGFVQVAAAAFYGALEIYASVKAALLTAIENTTAMAGDIWDAFVNLFISAWDTGVNFIEHTIAALGSYWDAFCNTFLGAWDETVGLVKKGYNEIKGLFDDSFDVKAANTSIDDENADRKNARDKADQSAYSQRDVDLKAADKALDDARGQRDRDDIKKNQDREAQRQANVDQIAKDKQAAIDDLDKREAAISGGADANKSQELSDLDAQKAALQKQLDDLRQKAKDEKKKSDDKKKDDADPKRKNDVQETAGKDAKSAGIFNAAAILTLQGASPAAETTAKNTTQMVVLLNKILKGGGITFQ